MYYRGGIYREGEGWRNAFACTGAKKGRGGTGSAFCTGAASERAGKVQYSCFYRGGDGREKSGRYRGGIELGGRLRGRHVCLDTDRSGNGRGRGEA